MGVVDDKQPTRMPANEVDLQSISADHMAGMLDRGGVSELGQF